MPEPPAAPTEAIVRGVLVRRFVLATSFAAILVVHALLVTQGSWQFVHAELLGDAYDSLARSLVRGEATVEPNRIQYEAFLIEGKTFMYFGPLPAMLRVVANRIWPAFENRWSRISLLTADLLILLVALTAVRRQVNRNQSLSPVARDRFVVVCLLAIGVGSPLVLLMSLGHIYHEAIAWALAGSLAAIWFFLRLFDAVSAANLGAFSAAAGIALLSRPTFAVPYFALAIAIAAVLLITASRAGDDRNGQSASSRPRLTKLLLWIWLVWSWTVAYGLLFFNGLPDSRRTMDLFLVGLGVMLAILVFAILLLRRIAAPRIARMLPIGNGIRVRQVVALAVPLAAALALYGWYNQERFGNPFVLVDMRFYPNYTGVGAEFDVRRIPFGILNYFAVVPENLSATAPFFHHAVIHDLHPALYSDRREEWVLALPLSCAWLLLGAVWGLISLAWRHEWLARLAPLAYVPMWIYILGLYYLSNRYALEFVPLLWLAFMYFLSDVDFSFRRTLWRRLSGALALGLVLFSIPVNILATLSFSAFHDWALSPGWRETLLESFERMQSLFSRIG